LPDQSRVHLKENASVTFNENFGKTERRVKLTGDAFFRVSKDKTKKFIVETDEMNITVLGTSFMVFSEKNTKKVYVNSGKVAVANGNEKVEINPGFVASKEKTKTKIETGKTPDTKFLEWRKQNLSFKNCKLKEAALTIEDIYNLKLNIDPKVDENLELTADFKLREANEIIEAIALSFGLNFEKISENEYKIY
ncbi:MAG TPA: hypothetical protein DCQ31_02565, partial [Bacteroidales bacterium]|nr:hypothetical protein [Bacteroidales bacterium]